MSITPAEKLHFVLSVEQLSLPEWDSVVAEAAGLGQPRSHTAPCWGVWEATSPWDQGLGSHPDPRGLLSLAGASRMHSSRQLSQALGILKFPFVFVK